MRRALIGGVVLQVACGRSGYVPRQDGGMDSSIDAFRADAHVAVDASLDTSAPDALDVGFDAGFDAGNDVGSDAGNDVGQDAARPRVLDIRPDVLRAEDWAQRHYVSSPGCVLTVTYVPTGGNPGDCMRLELSGCESTGTSFMDYLEWLGQDLVEARDGVVCRVDVTLDVRGESPVSPGTPFRGWIGVQGTHIVSSGTTGQWPSVEDIPPLDWTHGNLDISRPGIVEAGVDVALPMHLTVAFKIDRWTSVPDQVLYLDNPTFHVVFDDNDDGLCP